MPIRLLYYGVAAGALVLIAICYMSVRGELVLWRAALMAVLGVFCVISPSVSPDFADLAVNVSE